MTDYVVSIYPDAQIQIDRIADWLNYQSPGLGERFHDQVRIEIKSLMKNPGRYPIKYRDVHHMSMKNFPYLSIRYVINEQDKKVRIDNLVDTRRGPNHHPRRN